MTLRKQQFGQELINSCFNKIYKLIFKHEVHAKTCRFVAKSHSFPTRIDIVTKIHNFWNGKVLITMAPTFCDQHSFLVINAYKFYDSDDVSCISSQVLPWMYMLVTKVPRFCDGICIRGKSMYFLRHYLELVATANSFDDMYFCSSQKLIVFTTCNLLVAKLYLFATRMFGSHKKYEGIFTLS